jgi:aminoglycoside 6'-N-acetyltransferase-1b/aminoglycoside 6'-N-acetyltransferase-2
MYKSSHPVTLRAMTEADLPVLHDWLNRPHIVQWWGGEAQRPTLKDVVRHYLPRVLAQELAMPCVTLLGTELIGYAQSCVAMGIGVCWWPDETDPGVRGIDQFLAQPVHLNQGLGMQLVLVLLQRLYADLAVTKIQTDPAPGNHRAIRCYQKAGLVQDRLITTPDVPAVYTMQTRQVFIRRQRCGVGSTGAAG